MKNTTQRIHQENRITVSNVQTKTMQAFVQVTHSMEKAKLLNERNKLLRRYSFDDNGGGYAGL